MDARLPGDPPSPYEERWGYSRVVRSGPLVSVSGTTSISPDGVVLGIGPYEQAVEVFARIANELGRVGAGLPDVVSLRLYVTDIANGEEIGRALHEAFGEARPTASMVEVRRLADERMLVEVEATAWSDGGQA